MQMQDQFVIDLDGLGGLIDDEGFNYSQFLAKDLSKLLLRRNYRRYFFENGGGIKSLLTDVIHDRDVETLAVIFRLLGSDKKSLPPALLSHLLRYACERFFDEGVEVLLLNGADPNSGVAGDDGYGPLANMVDHAGPERAFLMTEDELYWYATPLANIFRSLVAFGANLTARFKQLPSMWATEQGVAGLFIIAIHKIAYVALYGPEAARVLIESTPARGILAGSNEADGFQCSPLSSALYDAMYLDSNFGPDRARLLKIVSHAVLPLLRAGASLSPDPFERDRIGRYLPYFCCDANRPDKENVSLCLWGRRYAAIELLIHARRKGSLDVAKLLKSVSVIGLGNNTPSTINFHDDEDDDDEIEKQTAENHRKFGLIVKSFFPLRLEALCRHAVLNHLPVGYHARQAAIATLKLPKCVADFLNFNELEPFHN